MKKILVVLLLAFLVLQSCHREKNEKSLEVVILHTNDMHGAIDGFAKIAALRDSLLEVHEHLLIISAGDLFSGNPVVDYFEPKGYPMIDLMNDVGYDLTVIGNHEFDYGQDILQERIEQASFPFICANMNTANTILPQPNPFHVCKIENIELFFLGLLEIGNQGRPSTHPAKLEGIAFDDPVETAGRFIGKKKDYNAFIALSHLGWQADERLANTYGEFDVIIGGHSHSLIDSTLIRNGVLIAQANDDLDYAGIIRLTFHKGELVKKSAEVINIRDYKKEDEEILAKIIQYNNNKSLNQVIGFAASDMRGKEELGALFTDAQTSISGLDFAFQNNGGIRVYEIPQGKITAKTVYTMDPFGNELMEFSLRPEEIRSLLSFAYNRYQHPGLQISGGSYTINVDKNSEIQNIQIYDDNGEILHADSTYSVGLSSYIASSYQFDHQDKGKSHYRTTAENIIAYIEQKDTVDYAGVKRVFVDTVP